MLSSFKLLTAVSVFVVAGGASAQTAAAKRGDARPQPPADALLPADISPAAIAQRGLGRINFVTGDIVTADLPNILEDRPAVLDEARHYLLQFNEPVTRERRDELRTLGIELGQYLPTWTYHVRLNNRIDLDALAQVPWVQWLGEFRSNWKIDPQIGQRAFATEARQQLQAQGQVGLLISLFEGEPSAPVAAQLAAMDIAVSHIENIGGNEVISATMPLADVPQLASINAMQFVEEAYEVTFRNDSTRWIIQSNTASVTPLYDNGLFGEGQIVGILDGRIRSDHCAFEDPEGDPFGPDHRKIEAYNASLGSDSHGTHVAGTVCGDAGDGENQNLRGIAYEARLVFDTVPAFSEAGITGRLNQHHSQGARIHTNSWGDDGTTAYNSLARGFDVFLRDNEDDMVLLAVTNGSLLKNPENAKNLLACGGTDPEPNQSDHCTGGDGPTSDGRRKPEAYAPGCSSISASSFNQCGTSTQSGTSMATPAIAGIALLMREYFMDGYYPTGAPNGSDTFIPSGALLKAAVINSCVDMTGTPGYPSNEEGWGRVLSDDALYFAGDARSLYIEDVRHASGLNTTEQHEFFMQVDSDAEKLKITMVFTDEPGAAGVALPVVNDLDLEVESPTGTIYKGNVFSGGVSTSGGTADDLNNVEQVHINAPASGLWKIRVIGTDVSVGPQGYAIVATGDVQAGQPALTLELASGSRDIIDPGVDNEYTLQVTNGSENVDPASVTLAYRLDDGAFIFEQMADLGGGVFTATMPAALCSDQPEFFFFATGDGGTPVFLPATAPAEPYAPIVGTLNAVIDDNFESDLGWSTDAEPEVTAGFWERGVPVNDPGWQHDPESDSDGSGQCYLTGNFVGNSDVDGGAVTLISPVFSYSGGDVLIDYDYFLVRTNFDFPSGLAVEVLDSTATWVEVIMHDTDNGAWVHHTITQADLDAAGVTLGAAWQIRFIAIDAAPGGTNSVVEAGIDALLIEETACEDAITCPGDVANDDGLVNLADLLLVISNWGSACLDCPSTPCPGDTNDDCSIDLADLLAVISAWGTCD